jgi:adenosylcobinamide kinase/adenosylcobinamide-phosphate guanylyltransferase
MTDSRHGGVQGDGRAGVNAGGDAGAPGASGLPPLTLVTGGARSGKSAFAEALLLGSGRAPVYIATAAAFDDEMAARIARHRAARAGRGWRTVEAGSDLGPALGGCGPETAVLVDCATLWLTGVMLSGGDCEAAATALLAQLAACPAPAVVVSNEVGWSIVPDNALARAFRDAQGRLNQRLAAQAGLVVAVIAGLPLVLKGRLP